jgi:hypothetical protein
MRPDQSEVEGKRIAEGLLCEFGIEKQHLQAGAYVDLLAKETSL